MNMQVLQFEGQDVRTLMRDDMPWWVHNDACRVLEIGNPRNASARLDDDEKGVHTVDTLGGIQELTIINESGLYSLILTSRKPAAKRFKKWLTSEVLPALRREGFYAVGNSAEHIPANSDDIVFGVRVAALNAAARTAAVIERIYGPEAARALWELDKRLPQVADKTVTFHANSEDDDPEKCLHHLLNADSGDGRTIVELLVLGLLNKAEAKKLRDYGIIIDPPEAEGHVAIMNQHQFLAAIYADTHWCLEWQASLVQLEGAYPTSQKGYSRKKPRAVLIPKTTIDKMMSAPV